MPIKRVIPARFLFALFVRNSANIIFAPNMAHCLAKTKSIYNLLFLRISILPLTGSSIYVILFVDFEGRNPL